jgi:integrase/recombinase XerC
VDDTSPSRASRSDVQAAWLLLDKMGLTLADLQAAPPAAGAPSFRAYIPQVAAAVSPGTRRVYGSYWAKITGAWGDRPISEPTALEISQLAEQIRAGAVKRANGRGGRGAAEHLIAALRCMYRYAVAEHIIAAADNPAAQVAKPRRLRSTRMALTSSRLTELYEVAGSTGDDPALDTLLLRLHTETACRPGGALSLRPASLDRDLCLIRLCEKGETMRWQPVSPTLMTHLLAHGEHRGGLSTDTGLLRYADGKPITKRRYNHLWERLGQHLPWVAQLNVSTGWIRHTTLTWVERRFGFAVAEAYAGHEDNGKGARSMAAMGTYIRADLPEVASALAALTGEPHPLATQMQAPGYHEAADDTQSGH